MVILILVFLLVVLIIVAQTQARPEGKSPRSRPSATTNKVPRISPSSKKTVWRKSSQKSKATKLAANIRRTGVPISKEELTPHALAFFSDLKRELPPAIACRLRSNRLVVNHGSYNNLFLFDIWDNNQTDVLDRKHFKYCLAYDPSRRNHASHDGYFHLWLNTIRIYRKREEIVRKLEAELPKTISKSFKFDRSDRAISAGRVFTYPDDLSDLSSLLVPWYKELIVSTHSVLAPIIDQFTTDLAPGERRAIVAARGKIPFTIPGVRDPKNVREYTRSIPPSWRAILLEKYDHKCFLCGADLRATKYHIDHWTAFSKGGTSEMSNLRPLCAPCNLKKGNRDV